MGNVAETACDLCAWDERPYVAAPLARACRACLDDFQATLVAMAEAKIPAARRRYLHQPCAPFGPRWAEYSWLGIGVYRPVGPWRPEFYHTPTLDQRTRRPNGHIELWEIRVRRPPSTLYIQHIARPGRPEQPAGMGGVIRGTPLGEIEQALAAFDLFDLIERELVRAGGRPKLEDDPTSAYWEHIDTILKYRAQRLKNPEIVRRIEGLSSSALGKYLTLYNKLVKAGLPATPAQRAGET